MILTEENETVTNKNVALGKLCMHIICHFVNNVQKDNVYCILCKN